MYIRLAFASVLVFCLSSSVPAADPPAAPAPKLKRDRVAELVDKLNASIDDPIQPNGATVKEYLAKLAKAQDVEIELDEATFKGDGDPFANDEKLSFRVPKGVRLHTILGMVCGELNNGRVVRPVGENDSDRRGVLLRDGRIIVTTRSAVHLLQGRGTKQTDFEDRDWTLLTTVWVIASDDPLSAVLRRMAEVYDVNVVITSQAAKLAETRITARILNAPLGTAIRSLADQCELAVFVRHNVILVTVPEHAKKLKQEQDWLQARREVESKTWAAERAGLEKFGEVAGLLQLRNKLVDPTVDEKVTVDVRKTPFHQVISNLTGAGFNITLDPAIGKKADTEVTAKLNSVACEAVVKQLAELAGLSALRMDNSLFITTPEKASRLVPAPPKPTKPKKQKGKG